MATTCHKLRPQIDRVCREISLVSFRRLPLRTPPPTASITTRTRIRATFCTSRTSRTSKWWVGRSPTMATKSRTTSKIRSSSTKWFALTTSCVGRCWSSTDFRRQTRTSGISCGVLARANRTSMKVWMSIKRLTIFRRVTKLRAKIASASTLCECRNALGKPPSILVQTPTFCQMSSAISTITTKSWNSTNQRRTCGLWSQPMRVKVAESTSSMTLTMWMWTKQASSANTLPIRC